ACADSTEVTDGPGTTRHQHDQHAQQPGSETNSRAGSDHGYRDGRGMIRNLGNDEIFQMIFSHTKEPPAGCNSSQCEQQEYPPVLLEALLCGYRGKDWQCWLRPGQGSSWRDDGSANAKSGPGQITERPRCNVGQYQDLEHGHDQSAKDPGVQTLIHIRHFGPAHPELH